LIGEFLGLVVSLAFVLGLAWIVLAFIARTQAGGAAKPGAVAPLRHLRTLPVGPRERLVVVAYEGEQFLLGVTTGGVSLLDRRPLPPSEPAPPTAAPPEPTSRTAAFLQRLARRR
jgi:flagellar biosynthetic protein FliO